MVGRGEAGSLPGGSVKADGVREEYKAGKCQEQGGLTWRRCTGQITPKEYSVSNSDQNGGKAWSSAEVRQLKQLARENTPTRVIGLKLGRTASAVYSKASEESIRLKPSNQSPYGKHS